MGCPLCHDDKCVGLCKDSDTKKKDKKKQKKKDKKHKKDKKGK